MRAAGRAFCPTNRLAHGFGCFEARCLGYQRCLVPCTKSVPQKRKAKQTYIYSSEELQNLDMTWYDLIQLMVQKSSSPVDMANIPFFTRVLYIPGGWPWDFWTINDISSILFVDSPRLLTPEDEALVKKKADIEGHPAMGPNPPKVDSFTGAQTDLREARSKQEECPPARERPSPNLSFRPKWWVSQFLARDEIWLPHFFGCFIEFSKFCRIGVWDFWNQTQWWFTSLESWSKVIGCRFSSRWAVLDLFSKDSYVHHNWLSGCWQVPWRVEVVFRLHLIRGVEGFFETMSVSWTKERK